MAASAPTASPARARLRDSAAAITMPAPIAAAINAPRDDVR